jgi:hypothetical protein
MPINNFGLGGGGTVVVVGSPLVVRTGLKATTPLAVPTDAVLNQILHGIVGRIVACCPKFTAANTAISLRREPIPQWGDQYCLVAPAGYRFGDANDGSGRFLAAEAQTVYIRVYTHLVVDEGYVDAVRLTDASVGLIRLARDVLNAVQDFTPQDPVSGAALVVEAIRGRGGPDAVRYGQDGADWLYGELALECLFAEVLDTSIDV